MCFNIVMEDVMDIVINLWGAAFDVHVSEDIAGLALVVILLTVSIKAMIGLTK